MNSNPNGANQHTPDERQQVCWDLYVDSIAKGKPNATKAAEKAGYSPDQCRNITLQGWFKGRVKGLERIELVSDSEKVLKKVLVMDTSKEDGREDSSLLRVQLDAAKHVSGTIGGYSTKTEVDHTSGGEPIKGFTYVVPSETKES